MIIERVKYEKLFSTPVFRFHFPEHAQLNAALLDAGQQFQTETDGITKSNRGGWHSPGNLFERSEPCFKVLREIADQAVIAATQSVGSKADLEALKLKLFAWMNSNPSGAFNAPHTHPGAHWSGVYYVSQPDVEAGNSGMIEFLSPRTDLADWRILDASPFKLKKKFRPQPGDIVVFPSYLIHWVYPNESDQERVTVAFNGTFRNAKKREAST